MKEIVISGTGFYHPDEKITNEELVDTFNKYVEQYNKVNQVAINSGIMQPLKKSSAEFIEKASGIKSRYVRDKLNLLNPTVMKPFIPERSNSDVSLQAEAALFATKKALADANKHPSEIDAVIMSSSHKQRDFPCVSIEIQKQLNISGFAFDMSNACSSATFGIASAFSLVHAGLARSVLLVSPEIKSGQFCTTDRDSHFIFGEATSAIIIESRENSMSNHNYKISDISLHTDFSNNIRNNRGAYNVCSPNTMSSRDKYFTQNGRLVYKEVTQLVSQKILKQLSNRGISTSEISRFWLHQANSKMNKKIISNIINIEDCNDELCPEVLSEFGNTSSAGVIVAFTKYNKDLCIGSKSLLCSFGAGYTVGSILLEKVS